MKIAMKMLQVRGSVNRNRAEEIVDLGTAEGQTTRAEKNLEEHSQVV